MEIKKIPKATWGERWYAFKDFAWGVSLIVVVLGGIYAGWFTPTEAAAMSAVYAFLIEMFIYKDMKWSGRAEGAAGFGQHERDDPLHRHQRGAVLVSDDERTDPAGDDRLDHRQRHQLDHVPAAREPAAAARGQRDGAIFDPCIMAPILYPIAVKLGINPIHFGIILVVNMEIGMCHPPVGLNLVCRHPALPKWG